MLKNKKEEKKVINHKKKYSLVSLSMAGFTIFVSIGYLIFILLNAKTIDSPLLKVGLAGFLFIITILISMVNLNNKQHVNQLIGNISLAVIILFTGFNFYIDSAKDTVINKNAVISLNNMNLSDAMKWADEHKITLEQKYEYSDIILLNYVIGQSVPEGTSIKEARNMMIYISSGPDLNKETNAMNMVGWPVNDVVRYIKDNHLANVNIDYVYDPAVKKDNLISQSRNGVMLRKDELNLVFSWGPEGSLKPVKMVNLINKTAFDANLWLKRNGFKYESTREFSNTIIKDNVTSQSITKGKTIDPAKVTIKIGISKGKKIVVPDLMKMSVNDITSWVVKYKLKLSLTDAYHESIAAEKIISANFKKGDSIEEGTSIIIVKSKGQLIMTDATTLAAITEWANKYGVNISQRFEYSTKPKGEIISISHKAGRVIKPGEVISISTSQGQPITVPTFIGKSWSSISSTCKSIGLSCSYAYGGYGTVGRDIATSQSVTSGSKVMSGTYVKVTLSLGTAQSFTVSGLTDITNQGGYNTAIIATIRNHLSSICPGVNFYFSEQEHPSITNPGYIHPSSAIKDGALVKQGQGYTITLTK